MRSVILFNMVLAIAASIALPQPPDTLWTRTFGGSRDENGYIVQQTTDGGYIIIGKIDSYGVDEDDIWLIKTDADGDTLWTRTIGGIDDDVGCSGEQTTDGGYIIAGHHYNFSIGESDFLLVKTNSQGDTSWTRTYGGPGEDFGRWVQQTNDGGYIIVGQLTIPYVGNFNLWIVKTDANGDTQWTRTYGEHSLGIGQCVHQTSDNGYIITGQTVDWSSIWLLKIASNGDSLWTRFFGESDWNFGSSVRQTTDGGYIITGSTRPQGADDKDIWLIKTDANGDSIWSRFFGGTDNEGGSGVQQTYDGGYLVVGTSLPITADHSEIWLIKTNSTGDSLWTSIVAISDYNIGSSAQQTNDGGYIIAGTIWDTATHNEDICLIRLNSETSVQPNPRLSIPSQFTLYPAYPNPFNETTTITYSLLNYGHVTLAVCNILGQQVVLLCERPQSLGVYTLSWNAFNLSSGIYFAQLQFGSHVQRIKMLLLK